MENENQFEDLESVDKLDELMGKIQDAQKMSVEKQAKIDDLKKKMRNESRPVRVDEMKAEIEALEAEKTEFDEMTANAAAEAKTRLAAVRKSTEQKFIEDLQVSSANRRNATEREEKFLVDEESMWEEAQKKSELFKARAKEKALAKAKEIAKQKGGTPEEMRQIEAEEAKRIMAEEFAKIDDIAARSLQKLEERTLSSEKDAQYQSLLANQNALRSKLDGYSSYLSLEFTDVEPAQVKKDSPELTAMQLYDKAKALRGELESQLQSKQKRIEEIDAELAKGDNPDLAKEKAEILAQLDGMNEQIKLCNDKINEIKDKMSDEDRAKVEEIEKAEAEAAKKKKEDEEREGGEGSGEGEKGGKKGDKMPLKITGTDYYQSLGRWGKYKLKKQAYMIDEGKSASEVGMLRKLALLLPSRRYSSLAQSMLDNGDISMDPVQVDAVVKAQEEMQKETQPKEQPAKPAPSKEAEQREESAGDTYWSPEQKEAVAAWGALSDEEKSKVNENIRVVLDRMAQAQKGAEGQPQPKQPSKEPEK